MALVNVDTDLLRALIYVVDTGSFTQAAERLFRTQSAVSLQIKKLERLVTQQLLIRDKNRAANAQTQ
jgi:DNA-binding transcriptional LysR family regulator